MTRRIDELSDAAVEAAEADVERVDAPDFGDVLSRAQRIHAETPPRPRRDDVVVLQPFIAAARAVAEADVAAAAPPSQRKGHRRRSVPWKPLLPVVAAIVVAAAVLLSIAPGRRPEEQAPAPDPSQAASSVDDARPAASYESRQPSPSRPRAVSPPAVPEEEEVIEVKPEPEPEPAAKSTPKRRPDPPRAPEENTEPLADRLARLDALAQEQLGDGKVDAADRTLTELINLGGKRRLVELAYGDRFTIAHRRGDTKKQVSLWNAYLRRFPRGRLADDARAGLCRHKPRAGRDECWRAYLRDFPGGAYSDQARRELGSAGPGAP